MNNHRIFISIDVPSELKYTLEACIEKFHKQRFVRIPDRGSWHVTLVFVGGINETEIEVLGDIVNRAVSTQEQFLMTPSTVSFVTDNLPHKKPRMIWLNFKRSLDFEKLKFKIEDEMELKKKDGVFCGFRLSKRASLPHMTLVRFDEKHYHNLKKLLPEKGIDLSDEAGPFKVKSVNIMESFLNSEGAEHELIKTFPIGKIKF